MLYDIIGSLFCYFCEKTIKNNDYYSCPHVIVTQERTAHNLINQKNSEENLKFS